MADCAGIESRVTLYVLRHTFSTHPLHTTGSLELTRKALKHSHVETMVAACAYFA